MRRGRLFHLALDHFEDSKRAGVIGDDFQCPLDLFPCGKEVPPPRHEQAQINKGSRVSGIILCRLTYLPRSNPLKLLCPSELR